MTYSSSNPLALVTDMLAGQVGRTFLYESTHNSTDILATGFFAGCGDGSRGIGNDVGLRLGDLVISRASTGNTIPGRVSMHSVIASSANVASTLASSGWNASYDCTVSQSS